MNTMDSTEMVTINFAPIEQQLRTTARYPRKCSQKSSCTCSSCISPHALLSSTPLLVIPQSYAPIKKSFSNTEESIAIRQMTSDSLGHDFADYESAARELVREAKFDALDRLVSARLIHDWAGLLRSTINYCKTFFLSEESTSKRVKWVSDRATTIDIATVAREHITMIKETEGCSSFKCVTARLLGSGFQHDPKTLGAVRMAYY